MAGWWAGSHGLHGGYWKSGFLLRYHSDHPSGIIYLWLCQGWFDALSFLASWGHGGSNSGFCFVACGCGGQGRSVLCIPSICGYFWFRSTIQFRWGGMDDGDRLCHHPDFFPDCPFSGQFKKTPCILDHWTTWICDPWGYFGNRARHGGFRSPYCDACLWQDYSFLLRRCDLCGEWKEVCQRTSWPGAENADYYDCFYDWFAECDWFTPTRWFCE